MCLSTPSCTRELAACDVCELGRARRGNGRVLVENLVLHLERFEAPKVFVERARSIASDEARHVTICSHVVNELGFQVMRPAIPLEETPKDAFALAKAVLHVLIAGFAVAETMSVGGFAAARACARAPLARWALGEILRDEVGHGAFGEEAGVVGHARLVGGAPPHDVARVCRGHGGF
jgi:hypothetical protein